MKILIVKLGAIGDVLRTTSVLSGLKAKYDGADIDWLTSSAAKDVLLNNPLINKLFTEVDKDQLGEYDLVIGLEDDLEPCQLVSGLKAKKILGAYAVGDKVAYTASSWFDMSYISRFGLDKANELKKANRKTFQQHMAELLHVDVGHYVFRLTPDEMESGQKVVKNLGISRRDKVLGINTGAGKRWPLKSLSMTQTIELVDLLKKKLGYMSLILGGPDEQERNQLIAKETGMPNAGQHSLRNFAAIIGQTRLLVSSDSLAMHFGIALGKKLVVFFGPTSSAEIELYGLGTKVDSGMDCLVCYKKQCDKQDNCIVNLSVDKLFEAVKNTL